MPRSVGAATQRSGHISDRAKNAISQGDLFALAEWKAEDPDVPDGDWYKDFGTFKICGTADSPAPSYLPVKLR
jgi:hypothetical protein